MKRSSLFWPSVTVLLFSVMIGRSATKGQRAVTDPRQHLAQLLLSQLLEQRQAATPTASQQQQQQPQRRTATSDGGGGLRQSQQQLQPVFVVDQQLSASSPRVDRSALGAGRQPQQPQQQQVVVRGRSIGSASDQQQLQGVESGDVDNKADGKSALKEEESPDDALDKLLKKRANVEERRSKLKSSASFKTAVLSQLENNNGDGHAEVVRPRADGSSEQTCENCVDGSESSSLKARWTMPLNDLGHKKYYLGIFFKSNWYKANQFCRYHGMHLASIGSEEENKHLEKLINNQGFGLEHFWTSGTDQGSEGNFFWLSTGRPLTYTNWNAGEPNNFVYENGEEEHCLELWNRDGKGLKWNDTPCSFETYFICEVTG